LKVINITSTGKGAVSGPQNSPMDNTYGKAGTQRNGCWAAVPPPSKQKFKKRERERVVRHRSNILYNLPFSQNQPLELPVA